MKRASILLLTTIFLLLPSTLTLGLADDQTPIILGQSAPFTGSSGQFGRQMWLGAQTYFDEINRQGGIHGRKIYVEALDDQYDVDLAEKNTVTLLKKTDLFALFGYVGTPTLLKALPHIQKAREAGSAVFLFSNRSGAQQQRTAPYDTMVYNIRPSYAEETESLVDYLTAKGAKRVGLFIQDDSYGQSGKAGVIAALNKRGLTLTAEATYQRGAKVSEGMSTQAKTLTSKNVDAIIAIASYEPAAAFIRDSRDMGFSGPIANISLVGSGDLLKLLKSEGEKFKKDYTVSLVNSQVVPPVSETKIPIVSEYIRLTEKYPVNVPASISNNEKIRTLSFTGLEGFLNAKAFVEILKKAQLPLTSASFEQAINHDLTFDLGLGEPLHLSEKDHQATHKVYLTQVVKGAYTLLAGPGTSPSSNK